MRAPGIFDASRSGKSSGSWLSGVYQRPDAPATPRPKDGWGGGTEAASPQFVGPYSADQRDGSGLLGLLGGTEGTATVAPSSPTKPRSRATRKASKSYLIARSKSPRPVEPVAPATLPPPSSAPVTAFPGLVRPVSPERTAFPGLVRPVSPPSGAARPRTAVLQRDVLEVSGVLPVPQAGRQPSTSGYLLTPADMERTAEMGAKPKSATKVADGQSHRHRASQKSSTSYLFAPTDLEDAQRKGLRLDEEMRDLQREIDELEESADPCRNQQKDELQRQMEELCEGLAVLQRYAETWEKDARLVRV